MERISVTLSVFYDGQFFTALFERSDENGYSVARAVFAARPLDNEILELILNGYSGLRYSRPREGGKIKPPALSPKRRQRAAAARGGQSGQGRLLADQGAGGAQSAA